MTQTVPVFLQRGFRLDDSAASGAALSYSQAAAMHLNSTGHAGYHALEMQFYPEARHRHLGQGRVICPTCCSNVQERRVRMTHITSHRLASERPMLRLGTTCQVSSPERRHRQAHDFLLQIYVCKLDRAASGPAVVSTLWKVSMGHRQGKALRLAWSGHARSATVSTHVISFAGSVFMFGWLVRWDALTHIWRIAVSRVARLFAPGAFAAR